MISEQKIIPFKTKANVFQLNTCLSCTAVIQQINKIQKGKYAASLHCFVLTFSEQCYYFKNKAYTTNKRQK